MTGYTGVAIASAQPTREGEAGPDGGEFEGIQQPRDEGGSGREEADGATNGRVAPLVGKGEMSGGEQRVAR